jgi:hypothetical protein
MPKELVIKLIKTIYRDDEKEIADSLLNDTVGEFLNTIIGTMMGNLTMGERIFEMGLMINDSAGIPKEIVNSS